MKKSLTALALALALAGTLAACSTDKNPSAGNNGGTAGNNSGTAAGSGTGSAGQVTRRYNTAMNQGRDYFYGSQDYLSDGRYTAGSDGQVYSYSREGGVDLTRGARDIVRDSENVIEDVGRGVGDAVQDIAGSGNYSGTPSWEPDSSAVRY